MANTTRISLSQDSSHSPSTPSPSPSKSWGFNFPLQSKPGSSQLTQPNAHPYAIKTTSTALLSRSTSSNAQSANAVHRYVPLSASPSSPSSPFHHRGDGYDDDDDGEREYGTRRHSRPSRHRYSRSLTDTGPLPLPVPPGVGHGQSQSYSGASPKPGVRERAQSFADDGESGDAHSAKRRGSMGPPRTPASVLNLVLNLPEDPKVWTPEDVARYLGRVVRARTVSGGEGGTMKPGNGGHNSNEALASDLAAFVREKQIGGRGFMRMTEADLDGYGTPHIWRATFLSASRGLRQSSLRGRILPTTFHTEPDEFKDDNEEFPSPKRARRVRPRTRNSSLSSDASDISDASNASGRVRDMVDSLEKSSAPSSPTKGSRRGLGLELDEEGTASASSDHNRTSAVKHGHEHAGHVRGLPHRGSVNDLFGTDAALVQEKEARDEDVLQGGVARRNVHGREPRLLPFPPAPHTQGHGLGLLTPAHTGTYYALPTSPDHHYHDPKADYELGFRHAVVHHGPSPSNLASSAGSSADTLPRGDDSTTKPKRRLLPYPPVRTEMALHHPRPRRLVGVLSSDADVESADAATTTTTSDTEADVYVTAAESSNSAVSEDREHEPSIEELLARGSTASTPSPSANKISGVEAWEMELGETVKRISGSTSSAPFESPFALSKSMGVTSGSAASAEIGRKAARKADAEVHATTGTGRRGKDLKRGAGIMNLFAPLGGPDEENEAEVRSSMKEEDAQDEARDQADKLDHQQLTQREEKLARREERVAMREKAVEEREIAVLSREELVDGRETVVAQLDRDVSDRGLALDERESAISLREFALAQRESTLLEQESELLTLESGLLVRQAELVQREAELAGQLERVETEMEESVKELERARDIERERERAAEAERVQRDEREPLENQRGSAPVEMLKRLWGAYVLPIVGEERTPEFLKNTTPDPPTSQDAPRQISPRVIRRDFFLGRFTGGGYLVLMSVGVCAFVLRVVLGRRALGLGRR
ncbi:hypothetical protein M413DRAFT_277759 [Hebeloma cylindrosporum]|uniref:Uncharacterized protein n=1 Tax=Hebeloma cylindrosporum TaxID=76867 RepID=A0A0C3C0Y7_HEBCY|nr:hypothetical protein M413DRAFT_277759 [Hebeloma cylindrosporum h7]